MKRSCQSIEPLLHDYLEGWLDAHLSAVAEQHLQVCPVCRAKVAGWQAVATALQELPQLPAPAIPLPAHESEPRVVLRLATVMCVLLALLIAWRGHAWQPPVDQLGSLSPAHAVQTYATTMREWLTEAQRVWKAF